jgi:hypothetical protein
LRTRAKLPPYDRYSFPNQRQVEAAGTFSQSDALTGNSAWSRKLVYDETTDSVPYPGLLTTMCDARNVCSHPKSDQLNRVYEVDYSMRACRL